jgi:hypothetical protein
MCREKLRLRRKRLHDGRAGARASVWWRVAPRTAARTSTICVLLARPRLLRPVRDHRVPADVSDATCPTAASGSRVDWGCSLAGTATPTPPCPRRVLRPCRSLASFLCYVYLVQSQLGVWRSSLSPRLLILCLDP